MTGHPETCDKGIHVVEEDDQKQDLNLVEKEEDIDYNDIDNDSGLDEEKKKKSKAERLQ